MSQEYLDKGRPCLRGCGEADMGDNDERARHSPS